MATVKKIQISRNYGKRPTDNAIYCGCNWGVEKGQQYDLVQFSINELNKPYFWHSHFCVKCGTSEEKINNIVSEFAKTISDEQIKQYKNFLEDGEKWGWD